MGQAYSAIMQSSLEPTQINIAPSSGRQQAAGVINPIRFPRRNNSKLSK